MPEPTYTQCMTELEEILRKMQEDECDIDHLTAYTRRAAELLTICRSRLTATEQELQTVLASLNPTQQ